jgi:hypothetical protein
MPLDLPRPEEAVFEAVIRRHGDPARTWRLARIPEASPFADTGRAVGPNVAKNASRPPSGQCPPA